MNVYPVIDEIVSHYQSIGIKGVFFDFDLTLTKYHTWEDLGITNAESAARISIDRLRSISIHSQFMASLMLAFNQAGIVTGICSGQHENLLHRFVYTVYGETVYDCMKPFIIGREEGTDKRTSLWQVACNFPDIFQTTAQLCLIDDEPRNCHACAELFWTVQVSAGCMNPVDDMHRLRSPRTNIRIAQT